MCRFLDAFIERHLWSIQRTWKLLMPEITQFKGHRLWLHTSRKSNIGKSCHSCLKESHIQEREFKGMQTGMHDRNLGQISTVWHSREGGTGRKSWAHTEEPARCRPLLFDCPEICAAVKTRYYVLKTSCQEEAIGWFATSAKPSVNTRHEERGPGLVFITRDMT